MDLCVRKLETNNSCSSVCVMVGRIIFKGEGEQTRKRPEELCWKMKVQMFHICSSLLTSLLLLCPEGSLSFPPHPFLPDYEAALIQAWVDRVEKMEMMEMMQPDRRALRASVKHPMMEIYKRGEDEVYMDEDTHSLFYTYTALSTPVDLPGIYQFIALGSLDDRELDYYNSQTRVKVPRQEWMKEKMPQDYWNKGTQSRLSKEQWFKVNVDILIDRMRHNKTDLHVLQWRHGCVIESENGSSKFVKGIDEYSYDGTEFLSFDEVQSRWIAPVQAAEPTKRKWDGVDILNQYTSSYLKKECVDWLNKFLDLGQEELKQHSPPDVHLFVKKSVKDSKELTLTCLATGFYSKDVQVCLRKGRTSIPEHLLTSSGVRPNGDGTYQLRKSLEILEDEKALFDCQVSHSTLIKPITVSPGNNIQCLDCSVPVLWSVTGGLVGGALLTLAVIAGKVPRQEWMKEKMPQDYWNKGTQSRLSKEQWFKVNVDILIDRMRHNKTATTGTEFLSFDEVQSRWIAPVQAAEPTKRKWDGVDILNQYTSSYLKKECVDWLNKFLDLGQEELKQHSPPDVHLFVKKSVKDSKELTLTCLATGFYSKDVQVCLRKGRTSIPEHLLTSSGVRPNGDGTYQLRKSLEILEDEKALFDCQVSHSTLIKPITTGGGERRK
ncbi:H-2 class I histocompatibility antigen, L-D alpha chain [Bagarius yarrelli]|uniref:H-2 class I histocompatibility antigen, L-D alpha chain n=1 Tax=Bagarius yarrelli TaxID=175774 RepID=A0A556TM79_BAGYA|nr:H-2 class I histocompatibility antigen, L-D alpha chain [Bagarius yarrelli]